MTQIETFDYKLTAFIVARTGAKFSVAEVEDDSGRLKFVIENSPAVEASVDAFEKNGEVKIQEYIDAAEQVKDKLMNLRRRLRYGVVYGERPQETK